MKKLVTVIMTLALVLCCVSISAVAEDGRQTASTVLDRDGEAILATVDLTGGWSVEFAYGALYLYNGGIAEGKTADAIGLTLEKEVYDEYIAEAENSESRREIENGVCYTSEETTYYVVAVGSSAYFLLDVPNGADGDAIYARLDLVNQKDYYAAQAAALAGDELYATIQPVVDSPEWVVNLPVAQDESTQQLFIVAGMGMDKTTATISMHQRAGDGRWKQILSTPGYVGLNGLCLDADHAEGCAQTPIGVYHFNKAFGIAADPGCAIPYIQVDEDTYWSGDPDYHYNEMMNINDYPELAMDDSEHIVDYEYQYQYCLNISFNSEGTPGRGSAIFLHCLGPVKPYTGGCVAIPEYIMKQIMKNVTGDCVVVIDTFENLNGSF